MATNDEGADDMAYYEQCLGACIVAVYADTESLWLHLSDGSAMEFVALLDGGFDIEIHPADARH